MQPKKSCPTQTCSAVESQTVNRGSPDSIPLCCCFKVWVFQFSPRCPSSLSCINEYLTIDSVPVRGSVVLCTAGLEDMAVALSPGKCGSYRQILSNNSVFPLASMPSQSNTRDRPYSPFKRFNIMQHQFDTGYVNNNMQNKQVW